MHSKTDDDTSAKTLMMSILTIMPTIRKRALRSKPAVLVMMPALGNPKCRWHSRLIFAKEEPAARFPSNKCNKNLRNAHPM